MKPLRIVSLLCCLALMALTGCSLQSVITTAQATLAQLANDATYVETQYQSAPIPGVTLAATSKSAKRIVAVTRDTGVSVHAPADTVGLRHSFPTMVNE